MKKKIKNFMAALGIVLGAFLLMLGLADPAPAADPDIQTIQLITPEWEDQTNGDGSGLFFDIVRAVFQPVGIEIRYRFAPWKRCRTMVNSGRADAMLCVWKEHAREQGQLIPAYPIFVEQTVAVFKKASRIDWQGIHSLDYKRAVWLRGYDYHHVKPMAGVQLARWHEVDHPEDAWLQLNLDRFDVYIEALIDLEHYIRDHDIDMNLYSKKVLWAENGYMGFSNTERSRTLIRIFDREIQRLYRSGALAQIYKKWGHPFFAERWAPKPAPAP